MRRFIQLLFWRSLAVISLTLGLIGLLLPVVPTVPFILVSAWARGKGWPALERWLLAQPHLGPAILQWRQYGIVAKRAKYLAIGMMLLSAILLQFAAVMLWLKIAVPLTMLIVGVWLWFRPEHIPEHIPEQELTAKNNGEDHRND